MGDQLLEIANSDSMGNYTLRADHWPGLPPLSPWWISSLTSSRSFGSEYLSLGAIVTNFDEGKSILKHAEVTNCSIYICPSYSIDVSSPMTTWHPVSGDIIHAGMRTLWGKIQFHIAFCFWTGEPFLISCFKEFKLLARVGSVLSDMSF